MQNKAVFEGGYCRMNDEVEKYIKVLNDNTPSWQMPFDMAKDATVRYVVSRSEPKYFVEPDGIYEKIFQYDQFGEVYTECAHKVISKEVFVEAFEKYIKE